MERGREGERERRREGGIRGGTDGVRRNQRSDRPRKKLRKFCFVNMCW